MAQAARKPHVTLNTDGQHHPRENTLAFIALGLGIISTLTAFNRDWHFIGTLTGLLGLAVGLYDQFISATRAERLVIIPAVVASAFGLIMGIAHGGFGL
jgi:hypothetical protein